MSTSLWAMDDRTLASRLAQAEDAVAYTGAKLSKLETALDLLKHRLATACADNDIERIKYIERLINTTRREIGSAHINLRIEQSIVDAIESEQLVRNPPRNPIARNRYPVHRELGLWERRDRAVGHD